MTGPRFKGILFDLGNTLIYPAAPWADVFEKADQALLNSLRASGLDIDDTFKDSFRQKIEAYYYERDQDLIEHTSQVILEELIRENGFKADVQSVSLNALQAFYSVTRTNWEGELDAAPTINTLRENGCQVGIISNASDDRDVQALVNKIGLRENFDFVITSAAVGYRKPHPAIFEHALRLWNIPVEQIAMVGDTLSADILGARNMGIYSIWITRRLEDENLDVNIVPDATISSLSELPLLLGIENS